MSNNENSEPENDANEDVYEDEEFENISNDGIVEEGVESDESEQDQDDVEIRPIIEAPEMVKVIDNNFENNDLVISKPDDRITSNIMTIYEFSYVLAIRARHIDDGGPVYVDVEGLTTTRAMAMREIVQKKSPLSIMRKLSKNRAEIWAVNDLTIPAGQKFNEIY
jgi:DNA-directed RNA polymerase I, II, and III subunit RPABC2